MAPPVAVITGAARGIGLEAARRLSATHRMALLDIDGDGVRRAAAEIGRDAAWVACDITDAHAVTAAVDEVVARCGASTSRSPTRASPPPARCATSIPTSWPPSST